uniref:PNPLA domain-containing protein n=1 Tax=Salvator merianae TaxID=96440 RepID=A0A8D0KMP2_SALMN
IADAVFRMSGTPFSLSFAGGGFLAIYEIGVIQALLEQAPEILRSAPKVYGASSGSLMAAAVVCKVSLDDLKRLFYGIACDSRRSLRSPFFPGCNVIRSLQKKLHQTLPENSHQMATGRLYVSLTRLIDGQNVVVSEYSSKEELIQVLICSCFVPIYAGFIPPSFRGVRYVDGGFTNLQPCSDLETAITVSPFTGETDICPRDCPAIFYSVYILQANIQISLENLCRFCYALFPPSWQVSCFSSGRRYVAGGSPSLLCTGSFRKAGKCCLNLPLIQESPVSGMLASQVRLHLAEARAARRGLHLLPTATTGGEESSCLNPHLKLKVSFR